jgi:transcriptional regulator with XRE-family HTH domain
VSGDEQRIAEAAEQLGGQFADRRRDLGLTQEQVAELAGIGRNQVQNIERGYSNRKSRRPFSPHLTTVVALCRVLRIEARIDVNSPVGLEISWEPELRMAATN